jgi:pilus assembly protein TadC
MNTLRIYPSKLRKAYEKNIKKAGIRIYPEQYHNKIFKNVIILTIILSIVFFILYKINIMTGLAFFIFTIIAFFILNVFFFFNISLKASARIKKIEQVFPDVISLMASNLRSGITIEKAFLLSARPEFDPLDDEILKTGKEIATGKDVIHSLKEMGIRIDSEKISKTINLIITGLKAGGNVSELLDETSRNMKEKEILEKKAASTILMYVIFIFVAVAIGAPALFGLSSVLVEVVMNLTSRMPDLGATQMAVPLTFNKISVSLNFIIYFSLVFIIITDLISCFVIGLVNKGEGKSGLKLFIPLLILSMSIFFIIRIFLSKVLIKSISGA